MLRKSILTLIFIAAFGAILYFFLMRLESYIINELESRSVDINKLYAQNLDFTKETPPPENIPTVSTDKLKQTAWIPDWDFNKGFASLQAKAEYFDSVSPVWYYLDDTGLIQPKRTGYDKLRAFTKEKNIKLIPSISVFKEEDFTKVLNDETKLTDHINYLISEVEKYDYDGLDLDYESFYLNDQPAYLYLIKSLANYLHSKGKVLTIALVQKATEADISAAFRQTKKVQDWQAMAMYADEMRIMTYDYTSYTTTYPGPISPIEWQEAILRYASTHIDSSKVVLAVPLYSYSGWAARPQILGKFMGILSNPPAGTAQAIPLTYDKIKDVLPKALSNILEPTSLEKVIIYKDKDKKDNQEKTFIAYYQDAETIKYRIQLAQRYGIGGIAYWRMGGEDLDVYSQTN